MTVLDADQYRLLIEAAPEGVALVDARQPEHPVVYVNAGFETLTGYRADELIGRNLRFLQGEDRKQEALRHLRERLSRGESCHVLLRNYRKDGSLFWNDLTVTPIRDGGGEISHYAGYARNAGDRLRPDLKGPADASQRAMPPIAATPRDDRLTGLFTLPYLEELLKRDWAVAQRERRSIAGRRWRPWRVSDWPAQFDEEWAPTGTRCESWNSPGIRRCESGATRDRSIAPGPGDAGPTRQGPCRVTITVHPSKGDRPRNTQAASPDGCSLRLSVGTNVAQSERLVAQ